MGTRSNHPAGGGGEPRQELATLVRFLGRCLQYQAKVGLEWVPWEQAEATTPREETLAEVRADLGECKRCRFHTTRRFRQICRRFGADGVVSEFISSVGISLGITRVLAEMRFEEVERPIGIQLYGADPKVMARAAAMVTELFAPDFVDINFDCPVKKVVRNNGGSGCLKDMTLVGDIIRAVVGATHLPVTVKIRSGWDEQQRDPVAIALRCQDAGARALTLHPRTRTQLYSGDANWDEIARVAEALDVPVVGNGDVRTAEDVLAMRRHTGCAAVMVARGSFGNPWLFARARALLDGRPVPPDPAPEERFRVALEHARLPLRLQGDTRRTALEFRKHLGWYTRGLPGGAELRQRLFAIESLAEAEALFGEYL